MRTVSQLRRTLFRSLFQGPLEPVRPPSGPQYAICVRRNIDCNTQDLKCHCAIDRDSHDRQRRRADQGRRRARAPEGWIRTVHPSPQDPPRWTMSRGPS